LPVFEAWQGLFSLCNGRCKTRQGYAPVAIFREKGAAHVLVVINTRKSLNDPLDNVFTNAKVFFIK
jgi:hypothetical protein